MEGLEEGGFPEGAVTNFPLTIPYTVPSSSMTEYVVTCHKLTFDLRVLEGLGLCQNILIHFQIY